MGLHLHRRGPATGDDFTFVLPRFNAKVMDLFFAHFAKTLDHDARALIVPDNVTLALLPPYSPELNTVEWIWLYLREPFLYLRVLDDTKPIIRASCDPWIAPIAEPDRMRSLCDYKWIMKMIS